MSESGLSPSERRRSLAAVIACISIYGITVGLTLPLLSLILEARGTPSTLIGLNAAMPALSTLLVSPLIPGLVARFGIKRLLYGCIFGDLAFFLALPIFDDLLAWFVIRFLMGATISGLFIVSETWINQIATEATRGRVMALYNSALAGCFALGPLVIPVAGIEGWTPFLVGALFIVLASIPLAWAGDRAPALEGQSSFGVMKFFPLAPTITGAVLLSAFVYTASAALLSVYGVRSGLDRNAAAVMLTALGLGGILLQFPIGWLADHYDRHWVLIGCAAGSGLGALLLPAAMGAQPFLWLMLFLWGGLMTGIYTVTMAIAGQRFRGMELATAMAAFGVLWGIGSLLGPPLAGGAMDLRDLTGLPAILVAANLMFVGLAVYRRLTRARRAPSAG